MKKWVCVNWKDILLLVIVECILIIFVGYVRKKYKIVINVLMEISV